MSSVLVFIGKHSIFEIIMLLCFGCAWPVSIYKSYTSRKNNGKSILFLYLILIGYVAGFLHKILFNYDRVIYLYVFIGSLVCIDILLYYRNKIKYDR
ncbi:MAG: hypothetical protein L3V56_07790 [Candidatus Magnetoovum sp. WYHC-5]|nr:hypothetical protein [Candidatus Magnetoovum sp. WYHC-5]